ncbi:DUF559 domain-containing protein [Faecalibacter bovis]|uniref:DUF559 domain-containing protein n=1 Tax=Faecalibacter bovis TaxID=2898187 RepID=A0ABX7XDH8_9FLAO|nr:DUF559 domain-containing protein [Faecalibacter bovis]QTV05910.1 DUF559 domain-containing protein [Faecalibacter bovis]
MYRCLECNHHITEAVFIYSLEKYNTPLCMYHQNWINHIVLTSTNETIRLYFALKVLGLNPILEKFDGYKHIDIAFPKEKINIEVDGSHHNKNKFQAMTDLQRTYYSFMKGFYTIRIPNSLVNDDVLLEEATDYIFNMVKSPSK